MSNLGPYRKAIVAIILLLANFLRTRYDIDFGMTPELATALINGVGALLVYLIPNSRPEAEDPHETARGV